MNWTITFPQPINQKLWRDLNKCNNCGNEFNDKYNLMNHSQAFSLDMFSTGQMLRV